MGGNLWRESLLEGAMSFTRKIFWVCALAFVGAFLVGSAGSWREYRSSEGRFSVKFLGDPTVQKMDKDGRNMTIAMVLSGDLVLMVAYTDIPESSVRVAGAEAILLGAQNGYLYGCKGTLVRSSEFEYGSHKGRTLEADLESDGFTRGFFLLADTRLYMVFALGPSESRTSNGVNQFLGSFKLLKQ